MLRAVVIFILLLVFFLAVADCHAAEPELLGTIHADTAYVLYGSWLIPLSDQNGDGRSELLVGNAHGSTYLFCGGQPFDTSICMRFDSTNAQGVDLGDINDDGFADLMIKGRSPYRGKMNVYLGGPLLDTVRDFWYGSDLDLPCLWPMRTTDLNRNGTDEVIIVPCGMDEVQVYELDGNLDSLPDLVLHDLVLPPLETGNWAAQVALGDFNGDGLQDLAVAQTTHNSSGENGRIHIFWGSPEFDSVPDQEIIRRGENKYEFTQFGRVMTCPGDLNADGFDDLFVASGTADDTAWVYLGGAEMDTVPGVVMWGYVNHAAPAGDINHDGYDDLITSIDWPSSSDGQVFIFYGGPSFDSLPDIRINNWDDTVYQINFGMAIVGLGDFNGDGVDDFAFSAVDTHYKGVVYIYSGTGEPTDVPDDTKGLPTSFTLRQNYPNPFNPSTTIEFTIPRRGRIKITVVDVLGQQVAVLTDGVMSSGQHTIVWGNEDAIGELASGVYFCLMEYEHEKLVHKMVLLK